MSLGRDILVEMSVSDRRHSCASGHRMDGYYFGQSLARQMGQVMLDINLDYAYSFGAVLVWLVIVLLISTLASILPARSATLISVRKSLAYA